MSKKNQPRKNAQRPTPQRSPRTQQSSAARNKQGDAPGEATILVRAPEGVRAVASLLLGLGALIGALVGAWIGCYLMERYKGRDDYEARQAAKGALVGRFLGIVVKCGIGAVMLVLTFHAMFASPAYPPVTTF